MAEQKFCQQCDQKHDCQKIYQQLGNIEAPSLAVKVIFAFLLPLVVFIASLAVFEIILAGAISTERTQTAISFLLAILVTFIFVVSCSLLVDRRNRK